VVVYNLGEEGFMQTTVFLNDSAIALTEADRPNEAISLFREALIMEPDNPLLWNNLGIAQQHTGDYQEALYSFNRAVDIDECLVDPWVSMGLIYYELDQFELSERCYRAALDREAHSPQTWNNLGVLYFARGCFDDARHCFEEAVSLAPLYYDALFNLRDTCLELDDYRAAAEFGRVLSGLESKRK
jgi:tetratricopeptide (TPR) repeat protein